MPRALARRLFPLAGALLVAATAAVALATVVLHADVERLAETANVVVDGRVTSTTTLVDAPSGTIWTVHDVAVREVLAGRAGDTLRVHVPGGASGAVTQKIAGTPALVRDTRYVLFLWRDAERLQVVGQAQGAFRVTRGPDGTESCRNSIDGLVLVATDGQHVDAEPLNVTREGLGRQVGEVVSRRRAAEERRRAARAARLARLKERAERTAERTRGKPGGAR